MVSRQDSSTRRSQDHQQLASGKSGELAKRICGSVENVYANQAVEAHPMQCHSAS